MRQLLKRIFKREDTAQNYIKLCEEYNSLFDDFEPLNDEQLEAIEQQVIDSINFDGSYGLIIPNDTSDNLNISHSLQSHEEEKKLFPVIELYGKSKEILRKITFIEVRQTFLFLTLESKETREKIQALRVERDEKEREYVYLYNQEMWKRDDVKRAVSTIVREILSLGFIRTTLDKVSMSELQRHSYISGKSGSGKSELLKLLFYRLTKESHEKQSRSLMLLDPHGDLAKEVKNLHFFDSDRLVYIDPYFENGYTPIINPFELQETDELSIEKRCQELTETITEIVSEHGLSSQMKTILNPCISTLLRMKTATIKDLQTFMDDENNSHLVERGKASPLPNHRDFFNTSFYKTGYNPTKLSIYTKLQTLLNSYTFFQLVNGKSTVNLKEEINKGKVLIFSLSKGIIGTEVSNAMGRLIIAIIKSIALSRADGKHKRKPVYMFIDECQNYISPSIKVILQEARKYGLHLVLSNQIISDFSPPMKKAVLSNTAVKIAGKNNKDTRQAIAGEIGIKATDISELPKYHFFIKTDEMKEAQILKPKGFLLDTKGKFYLSKEQEKKQKAYLLEHYYTKIESKSSSNGGQKSIEERKQGRQEQTPDQYKSKPRFDI